MDQLQWRLSGQCRTVQRSPALERLRCGRRCAWQRRTLRHTRRPRGLHWHVRASCSLRLSCSAPSAVSLHAVSLDASSGRQDTWGHVARRGEGRQRLCACACMVLQFVVVARPPLLRCARERVVCMRMPVRVRACGSVCAFQSMCLCVGQCLYGGVWVCTWEFVGARVHARACTLTDSLMPLHTSVRA